MICQLPSDDLPIFGSKAMLPVTDWSWEAPEVPPLASPHGQNRWEAQFFFKRIRYLQGGAPIP